jgi:hypothetical protein
MMFGYQSLVDKIPVIRNEKLILYAEANMLSNPFEKPEGL